MKLIVDEKIKEVDTVLYGVCKYLNLIRHVNPTNLDSEKKDFFAKKKRNPMFTYKPPRRNITDMRKTLEALEIPTHDLGKVYEKVRRQFLKQCTLIENVGIDDGIVKDMSSQIYGWPTVALVEYAKKVLQEVEPATFEYTVPSEVIMGSVQMMFDEIGLDDWRVRPSQKYLTTARHTKKVCVCEWRMFCELDVHRLAVHEVGVHAVRYANGYSQPLNLFFFGFADFLATEEGLATYFEVQTGNMNPTYFRNYAGRVIAIDCLRRGLDFRSCFQELHKYGFSDDDCWTLTVRAYRGGGFIKDHVYLEGYLMVDEFAKNGGNIKELFVGKCGIADLPVVRELLKKKIIRKPRYLPPFLK